MYFNNCKNLEELKETYRKLVLKHHPDMGGDNETMQEINAEHDKVFEVLKRKQNEQAKTDDTVKVTTETPEEFRRVVEQLIALDKDLTIELCGSWLWISGETYDYRKELKSLGCRWSKGKKKWYWHHFEETDRWHRGTKSMKEIRKKYGSSYLTVGNKQFLTA